MHLPWYSSTELVVETLPAKPSQVTGSGKEGGLMLGLELDSPKTLAILPSVLNASGGGCFFDGVLDLVEVVPLNTEAVRPYGLVG